MKLDFRSVATAMTAAVLHKLRAKLKRGFPWNFICVGVRLVREKILEQKPPPNSVGYEDGKYMRFFFGDNFRVNEFQMKPRWCNFRLATSRIPQACGDIYCKPVGELLKATNRNSHTRGLPTSIICFLHSPQPTWLARWARHCNFHNYYHYHHPILKAFIHFFCSCLFCKSGLLALLNSFQGDDLVTQTERLVN